MNKFTKMTASQKRISEVNREMGRRAYFSGRAITDDGGLESAYCMAAFQLGWREAQLGAVTQDAEVVDLTHLPTDHPDHPYQNGHWDETCEVENPKDAVGSAKVAMSNVPAGVMMEVGLAMMEGSRKYGRHNYRAAEIRASIYYDALMRHAKAWWEGQDDDPDSLVSHITKAIATLVVCVTRK